jgi:hypothetical protein
MSRRFFFKILFVAIVIFNLLAFSSALFAQGRSAEAFERVIEVQERHTERLMEIKGVVGTAVGLDQDNLAVVKVFTARGAVAGIPGTLDGVRVQPVVTGEFYALPKPDGKPGKPPKEPEEPVDPTSRFDRPVPIGVSTGHPDITAGTISCRVTDGTYFYALSNNHVYANENAASIGDAVIQPGTFDNGSSPADDIGTLFGFEEIFFIPENPFDPIITNTIDAAIASTTTSLLGNATPSNGYGMPKSTTIEAAVNQKVKKYGRTTELTTGQISAINATVDVVYDTGVARFINQIVITPGSFSAGGDSGSLIVAVGKGRNKDDDRKPVGLLFAGSDLYTIANPIDAVLDRFGVTIDGE